MFFIVPFFTFITNKTVKLKNVNKTVYDPFMIPSYFKIEILAIRDEFVTPGHKGLRRKTEYSN